MNDRLHKHLLDAAEAAQAVLGEAARRALDESPDLRHRLPDLAYAVGLRNRLVHGYDTVDDMIVFDTARSDLPGLIRGLRAWLAEGEGG